MAEYIPDRNEFEAFSSEKRAALMKWIAKGASADLLGMRTFSKWGQVLETGCFEIEGAEFVFIPGGQVTLGFSGLHTQQTAASEAFQKALEEDYTEYWGECISLEENLKACTTPLREVSIPPMLVERRPRPFEDGMVVSWEDLNLSESWQKSIDEFRQTARCGSHLILDTFEPGQPKLRCTKMEDDSVQPEVVFPATVEMLQKRLEGEGFTLPDEDIWEYLCSGGCTDLFPWGNNLAHCGQNFWKEQPNFFGLTIAIDPFHWEIVNQTPCPYRGGDGGEVECYGNLKVLNDLAMSPHFKGIWPGMEDSLEALLEDGLTQREVYRRIILLV